MTGCGKSSNDMRPMDGTLVLLFFSFVIIFIIVWLLLAALRPTWVQNKDENGDADGGLNQGLTILYAVLFTVIVWFFLAFWGYWLCYGGGFNLRRWCM